MSKKTKPSEIAAELKQRYPVIYAEIANPKERAPQKILNSISDRAQKLADGKIIKVPVIKNSFLAEARIFQEAPYCTAIEIISFKPNKKASAAAEKRLVNILFDLIENDYHRAIDFVEEVREAVYKSREHREFQREIDTFEKEVQALGKKYDFDYDRDIGIYAEVA